jgi:hypothetical protein
MSQENPTPEKPTEDNPAETPQNDAVPAEHQSQDARRRLRQLLAIPERDRSDAIWDEIIGLEIGLAPGNRAPSPNGDDGRHQQPGRRQGQGPRPEQGQRQGGPSGAKPARRMSRKPRRGRGGPPGR